MPAREIKIGLLWHTTNQGNLGLGALTIANIALARATAADLDLATRYVVFGMHEAGAPYISGPDIERININIRYMLSPWGYWRALGALNCILDIGGGDSFCEIYGPKRFFYLWVSKILAYLRGVPLLLSPQTIGPFTSSPYKLLAGLAMRPAVAVVARDPTSFKVIGELAPSAAAYSSLDVAFTLPFQDRKTRVDKVRPVRVGVNVSGMLFAESVNRSNRFGLDLDYAELMRRFIRHMSGIKGVEVHLIVHVNGPASHPDNDCGVADQLAREFTSAIRVPNFTGPSEAKSYISGLDFLVAARMHACIAAYSSCTPMVAVAYSRKFAGLFEQLDYPWIVPVKGATTDQALSYLVNCFDRRDELGASIRAGSAKVTELIDIYRRALSRLFAMLAETT